MSDDWLARLEGRLDELLQRYQRLQTENDRLRHREAEWQRERARLIEKNNIALSRIESLIERLKHLETHNR